MKRKSEIIILLAALAFLGGCILAKTPLTNNVNIPFGKQVTFSVNVLPTDATYAWTLDETPISNEGKSYVYNAQSGQHFLTVRATHALGTDTQTWVIQTEDPISSLLNTLVSIPGGTFLMGSTDDQFGWAQYTTPVHIVTLSGFEIGAYEVTQAQYEAVMGTNPSFFQGVNYPNACNNPVEMVTWFDAVEFCTKLSAQTGRTFTLPSEAQWEYACRAGSTTLYSFGSWYMFLGSYAWYQDNSGSMTHPVGTKLPNAWGLYDMHGNVIEWCLDTWHENYAGAPTDGSAWDPDAGPDRVGRSGAFDTHLGVCQSAFRWGVDGSGNGYDAGFRVVAVP
jgi:formylglycine-generating enzyme required for sulfatase activity